MNERTGFQEGAPYDETIDLRTDFVMVYGLNDTTAERIDRWRRAGYRIHLMTGISWGRYQDYLDGRWDGANHWSDAQTDRDGRPILHGHSTDVPYMVPTIAFTEYLIEKLRPILDLGVEAVHLEEPEFWARGGYSESFQREWQAYFGEPWKPPHASAEAHFRSCQLKQHLLARSLDRVTTVLRDEALRQGRKVRFYVPTHSLLNYAQWQIISPESRLRGLVAVDGAIAQVWTGTSRTPNVYAGRRAERTFETSFLEYGIAQELTRGTGRHLWFLHDPIEDHPDRTWEDYRTNYQRTLVASLLHPGVSRYEVAPWPNRIFNRSYLREGATGRHPIPADYATEYLVAMNTLRDMDQPAVEWVTDGPRVGVLLSDTAMFERWRPDGTSAGSHYDGLQDALAADQREQLNFSAFYGLALPPLLDGQRLSPVQLENVVDVPGALDDFALLILSYEFQKPLSAAIHYALAGWVANGGALLYVGDGSDPYHEMREWWTARYPTCAHHLAEALGVNYDDPSVQPVGRGRVLFLQADPASFTARPAELVAAARQLVEDWRPGNWLALRRGPYLIGGVFSESSEPRQVEGRHINLLDAELPLVTKHRVDPGGVFWLRELGSDADPPRLLASAARIRDWTADDAGIRYAAEAPQGIRVNTVLRADRRPTGILVNGVATDDWRYDGDAELLWLRHPGAPAGTEVVIATAR